MASSTSISESLVRKYARNYRQEVRKVLEANSRASSFKTYDIFLCHSKVDEEIILGIVAILEKAGLSVYVDWIDDPDSTSDGVTADNARMLKSRMNNSRYLVYVHTYAASSSKWCPWEVGYFDHSSKPIYVAMVSNGTSSLAGQEYLKQYERLTLVDDVPVRKSDFILNGRSLRPAFR